MSRTYEIRLTVVETKKTNPNDVENIERYARLPLCAEHIVDSERADYELDPMYYHILMQVKKRGVGWVNNPSKLSKEKGEMIFGLLKNLGPMVLRTDWAYIQFEDPRSFPQLLKFLTKFKVAAKRYFNYYCDKLLLEIVYENPKTEQRKEMLFSVMEAVDEAFDVMDNYQGKEG